MMLPENEILKMLFEEHHRQLSNKRQKIHNTSERTLALLVVIAGWLVINDKPLTGGIHWILIVAIALIVYASCTIVYRNNWSYFKIAGVMRDINNALGLFEKNKFNLSGSVYPEEWKKFGKKGKFWGVFTHYLMIIAVGILCIIAALMKV